MLHFALYALKPPDLSQLIVTPWPRLTVNMPGLFLFLGWRGGQRAEGLSPTVYSSGNTHHSPGIVCMKSIHCMVIATDVFPQPRFFKWGEGKEKS